MTDDTGASRAAGGREAGEDDTGASRAAGGRSQDALSTAPDPMLRVHLDALPVAVDLLDAHGRLVHANPAAHALRAAARRATGGDDAPDPDAAPGAGDATSVLSTGTPETPGTPSTPLTPGTPSTPETPQTPWGDLHLVDEMGAAFPPDRFPSMACLTEGGSHRATVGVPLRDEAEVDDGGDTPSDGADAEVAPGGAGADAADADTAGAEAGGADAGDAAGAEAGGTDAGDAVDPLAHHWFLIEAAPTPLADGSQGALVTYLDVTEERHLTVRLRLAELHDPLTGLANRRLLSVRFDQAQASAARTGQHLGLVYLDLDRFKSINDVHGHGAGDRFLREFGSRLQAITRDADTAARVGGDEFVVLCTHLDGALGLQMAASRIANAVDGTVVLDGRRATVGASVGWVLVGHEMPLDVALNQADTAMYRDKARRSTT